MDDRCELKTKISQDGLSARLIVPHDFDRSKLVPELCDAMLMRAGIELTTDTKKLIKEFIAKAQAAPEGEFSEVIARGTAPSHGEDGHIEWHLDKLQQPESEPLPDTPSPDANAKPAEEPVSFYDRSVFTVVKTGDVLGTIHHATPGQDGRDVTGKNLASRDGKALDFKYDESIMVGRGYKIIAQADGMLDLSGKMACIRDTIEVDNYVDFNTGNIRFNGSVVIRKGIRDCFTVEAEKDIEVHGLIEAATVIAGGDLRALGGFAGRNSGMASVRGNLHAKYLDAVKSKVRGDLQVDREIINCNTMVLGKIASPQGAIIGGETKSAGVIEVAELGAEGLPITTVQIGTVPHLDPLIHKLSTIISRLVEIRQKLVDEQELIQKSSGARVTNAHKERLCELMYEIAEVQTHLDRAEPSIESAKEKAEGMRAAEIYVGKKVHPNTVLICSGLRYRIKNELRGPLRIFLDGKGQLQVQYDGAPPAMLARQAELGEAA